MKEKIFIIIQKKDIPRERERKNEQKERESDGDKEIESHRDLLEMVDVKKLKKNIFYLKSNINQREQHIGKITERKYLESKRKGEKE